MVVPALHTVDRCVTCHLGIDDPRMTDEPNPHRVHPKKLLAIHRVEKFGCTVCHQGQGAALNFEEAKAEDYFWDYPLLPAKFTEATCASCHDPRALPKGSAEKLVLGMQLFEQKGCNGCHKLNGKGGQLGPVLDNEGLKTKHQFVRASLKGSQTNWNWFTEHFRDPAGIVEGSLMPMPALSQPQVEALTVFMLSLRQRDFPPSISRRTRSTSSTRGCILPLPTAPRSTIAIARHATTRACIAVWTRSLGASFRASEMRRSFARKTTSVWRRTSAKAVPAPACRAGVPRQGV